MIFFFFFCKKYIRSVITEKIDEFNVLATKFLCKNQETEYNFFLRFE